MRLKRVRYATLLVLLLVASGVAASTEFAGRVVGVTDGDTLTVLHEGHGEKIRLDGIDCPESHQAFGSKAKQFASELGFGKEVTVKTKGRDKYGRTIGEVILPDGRSLNRELVRAGLAWWYRQYSTDQTIGDLEIEARAGRMGLWADPNPVPPWDFRHGKKSSMAGGNFESRQQQPSANGSNSERLTPHAYGEREVRPSEQAVGGPSSELLAPRTYGASEVRPSKQETTLFITRTGRKYHRQGCRYLRKSAIPISLKDARAAGYTPCSVCGPPQ